MAPFHTVDSRARGAGRDRSGPARVAWPWAGGRRAAPGRPVFPPVLPLPPGLPFALGLLFRPDPPLRPDLLFRAGLRAGVAAGLALLLLTAGPAGAPRAADVLPGPVPARVVRVIDGDTFRVRARIWIGQEVEVNVRLDGIDAPELKGACGREQALARQARDLVAAKVEGAVVALRHVRTGKFAGRVVASVETPEGEDLATLLHAAGLARPYDGGRRASWCETAAVR